MARFKEYYTEVFPGLLLKGVASKVAATAFRSGVLRKLGLTAPSLDILSGGQYFKWKTGDQKIFQREYAKFLKMNKGKNLSKSKLDYEAMKYLQKKGVVKDNPYFGKNVDFKQFTNKIGRVAKGTWATLKSGIAKHGSTALTILKAMK
jgi:hypothetical protein